MLVTRPLVNTNEPLVAPDGALLANVRVTFTLVDVNGKATDAFDAVTHERVTGVKYVDTDTNGIFSALALWPNDRGSKVTLYLCHVHASGVADIISPVPSADLSPLSWAEFYANGTPLTPQQLDALQLHIADHAVHLDASAGAIGYMPVINATQDGFDYISPPAGSGGSSGDMVLASAQTNTGAKTFLNATLLLRNIANTFSSLFSNANTAARTYTLQDRNGTLADDTDLAGKVDKTTTVNGHALNANVTVTAADVGLGNVDNTSDANKPVSTAQAAADAAILASANAHSDGLVVGLWDDRGSFDASVNTYPTTGGSGAAGAILKGDIWTISVLATSGSLNGYPVGSTVRAKVDTPGQTVGNWAVTEVGLGYVPENATNKNATGGYVGLTGFSHNLVNALGTITSFLATAATAARTWTFPDKSGTVAMTSDITGTNSGTNTGDQTITLTGDVTGSGGGSFAAIIAANAVSNAKLAQMATLTLKGNNSGGTANAADLTVPQVQAMLNVARVFSEASNATPAPNCDSYDAHHITALAVATTIGAPTGTPTADQLLLLRITDNGTARAIAWNAIYHAVGAALPTTTTLGKDTYCMCVYDNTSAIWHVFPAQVEQ